MRIVILPNFHFCLLKAAVTAFGFRGGISKCTTDQLHYYLERYASTKDRSASISYWLADDHDASPFNIQYRLQSLKHEIVYIKLDLTSSFPVLIADETGSNSPILSFESGEEIDEACCGIFGDIFNGGTDVIKGAVVDLLMKLKKHLDEVYSTSSNAKRLSKEETFSQALTLWEKYLKDYMRSEERLATFKAACKEVSGPNGALENETFESIFMVEEWKKYLDVLSKTTPPLIDERWNFIGGHATKGVIANYFWDLKAKGIIDQRLNRQRLAAIINKEIVGVDIGDDGSSLQKESSKYRDEFEEQLEKLLNEKAQR